MKSTTKLLSAVFICIMLSGCLRTADLLFDVVLLVERHDAPVDNH